MRILLLLAIGLSISVNSLLAQQGTYREELCHPTCSQCNPGECVATNVKPVPMSKYVHIDNPPCDGFTPEDVRVVARAVAAYLSNGATLLSPETIDQEVERFRRIIHDHSNFGGDIERYLKGVLGADESSCTALIVAVPSGARVTRVLTGMDVNGDGAECPSRTNDLKTYNPSMSGLRKCPQGWTAFTEPANDGGVWTAIGKNWNNERNATANFRVFYRP